MLKRFPLQSLWLVLLMIFAGLTLGGCQKQNSAQINFEMGERITAGPLSYNVVQTAWKTQLGDLFNVRVPDRRYLLVLLSVTNGTGKEVSLPFFTLQGPNSQEYKEIEKGDGVDNWFGLLRNLNPAETKQGNLLFDVPLTSFRLRLTDGGDTGAEKFVWVDIPLHLDSDTSVSVPTPGPPQ
jgi:uncharacterized protein DUF4352